MRADKPLEFMPDVEEITVQLPGQGAVPNQVHVFDQDSLRAINAALAARRPLLVCGEPGIGKSQLARAAAKQLGRAYVPSVVDSRTESRNLLWRFDAVARLADAQLCGALGEGREEIRERLQIGNYLYPGPLWWAFHWEDANLRARQAGQSPPSQPDSGDPSKGCVVLVDEIDKAESDVPNGLLEVLGVGEFTPEGREEPVRASDVWPLVVITTNRERALPDAFVRRCLVLLLRLPDDTFDELVVFLKGRGRSHFPDMHDDVLDHAARMLASDREEFKRQHLSPLPGQAEYLDLLRAVSELAPKDAAAQIRVSKEIANFVLKKHLGTQ